MIRKILIALVVVVVAFVAVGFVLPEKATLSRSITIEAPPSTVFALADGFRTFEKWSPWKEKDPDAKVEISGPAMGVGAHYTWSGNKDVGSGSQEIVESKPYTSVRTKLVFGGFDQPSYSTMTLAPMGQGTQVTWSLESDFGGNPVFHYMGLFMDKMVGGDYEKGLANLKAFAETMPKTDFSSLNIQSINSLPTPIVYVSGATSTDPAVIGPALGAAYSKIGPFLTASGLKMAGAPLAITRRYDDEAKVYEFDAAIPVDHGGVPTPEGSEVKLGTLYAGAALKVTHTGPYTTLPKTYELIEAYKKAYGLVDNGNAWEQYIDDPQKVAADQLKTLIFVPVR